MPEIILKKDPITIRGTASSEGLASLIQILAQSGVLKLPDGKTEAQILSFNVSKLPNGTASIYARVEG